MNSDKIIELAFYTLPALITGVVAFYFFQMHTQNEEKRRLFALKRENQKQALPLRLQAYERLALFLERINPSKLLIRVAPISDNKNDYQNLLINHIEQEFTHNLTQQIYVTDECWNMIVTAKNTVIQNIRKTTLNTNVTSAENLRETILSDLLSSQSSTTIALSFLKSEVTEFL